MKCYHLILLLGLICLTWLDGIAQVETNPIQKDSIVTDGGLIPSPVQESQIDSISEIHSDTSIVKKERFKLVKSILDKKYPNPNRAAALSLLLPGAGQVYNKKYWKLPFVYGALGGLGYMVYFNNRGYNRYKNAYLLTIEDISLNPFPTLSESSLLSRRDSFNKKRQQGYIFFVAAWALNSIDAYVDAHLTSFDVDEDISMHVNPAGIFVSGKTSYGLSLQFTYKNKRSTSLRSPF